MSIIAKNPTTRHQVAQLKTKRSKPLPFGTGILPAAKPALIVMTDCGTFQPHAFGRKPSDSVSATDRNQWAVMSAEIDARRQMMVEFRKFEERAEVLATIMTNDLAWADNELMEARRFESYGW